MVKKEKLICPNCLSNKVTSNKGDLPGGAGGFEFVLRYRCEKCGYAGTMLTIDRDESRIVKKK